MAYLCGVAPCAAGPKVMEMLTMTMLSDASAESAEMREAALSGTASAILSAAARNIEGRGAVRDGADGERSMTRAVRAFNALFAAEIAANGGLLTEVHGWRMMELLKMARGVGPDEFVDGAAYAALAGEAAAKGRAE